MNRLARAVVFAVAYIDCCGNEERDTLDDDVNTLEGIAAILTGATAAEQDALAAAAKLALAEEKASPRPREDYVESYAQWMENMFGEPWAGNRRAGGEEE